MNEPAEVSPPSFTVRIVYKDRNREGGRTETFTCRAATPVATGYEFHGVVSRTGPGRQEHSMHMPFDSVEAMQTYPGQP